MIKILMNVLKLNKRGTNVDLEWEIYLQEYGA